MYQQQNAMQRVNILRVEEPTSKKGNKYQIAHCVIINEKNNNQASVGKLRCFKPSAELPIPTGDAYVEFEVTVDFDGNVTTGLVAVNAVPAKGAVAPQVKVA